MLCNVLVVSTQHQNQQAPCGAKASLLPANAFMHVLCGDHCCRLMMRRVTCLMRRRGTCLGGDTSVSKCMTILWVSVGERECRGGGV